jgi:hypothetical protein
MLTLELPRNPGIDGILEASAVRGSGPCRHIAGLRHPWNSTKTTFKPVSDRIFYVNHRELFIQREIQSLHLIYSFKSSAICIYICQ